MISGAGYNDYTSYYLSQFSQTQETNRTQSQNDNAITVEGAQRRGESSAQSDEVTISEEGFQAAEMIGNSGMAKPSGGPPPGGPPPGGGPEGADGSSFAEAIAEEEETFFEQLMAELEEAGVDTEQEIELGYDEEGNIIVTSDIDAEDKALIESILAEDADLAQSYERLTEMKNMAAEMEAMAAQGASSGREKPNGAPMGWMAGGQIANASNVASMYASQSSMASNSIAIQAMQAAT